MFSFQCPLLHNDSFENGIVLTSSRMILFFCASLCFPVVSFVPSAFFPQKHVSDWKPEIRLPRGSEYVVLSGLDWNTEYEVHVVAENQQGKSQPGILSFRTATEPTTIPGTIPIIPPRASTHTSHSAQRLPP